jgi:hypothetical protein
MGQKVSSFLGPPHPNPFNPFSKSVDRPLHPTRKRLIMLAQTQVTVDSS